MVKAQKAGVIIEIPYQSYLADYKNFGWTLVEEKKQEIKEEVKEVKQVVEKPTAQNKNKK